MPTLDGDMPNIFSTIKRRFLWNGVRTTLFSLARSGATTRLEDMETRVYLSSAGMASAGNGACSSLCWGVMRSGLLILGLFASLDKSVFEFLPSMSSLVEGFLFERSCK